MLVQLLKTVLTLRFQPSAPFVQWRFLISQATQAIAQLTANADAMTTRAVATWRGVCDGAGPIYGARRECWMGYFIVYLWLELR